MHLQHEVDLIVCLCVWSQATEAFRKHFDVLLVLPYYVVISGGSSIVNECESITLTYHECCTMSTTGLFPDAHSDYA